MIDLLTSSVQSIHIAMFDNAPLLECLMKIVTSHNDNFEKKLF